MFADFLKLLILTLIIHYKKCEYYTKLNITKNII